MKLHMLPRIVVASLLLGASVVLGARLGAMGEDPPLRLQYVVTVVPEGDFEVEARISGMDARDSRLRLLDGWGVLQGQGGHIAGLSVTDTLGSVLSARQSRSEGTVFWEMKEPPPVAVLRYRVKPYDPDLSPEASFAGRRRFVALGYSIFVMPEEVRQFERMPITVRFEVPEGWPVWASWPGGPGAWLPQTPHDLWSGVAAGGSFHASRMGNESVAVTVLTESGISRVMGTTIANRLLPVLREMHDLFGGSPRGETLDVLALYRTQAPRRRLSLMSGNSEESAFLCLATPDRYRDADQLTLLAAHECLHFYLGGAVTASPEPPFRNTPDLIWLMEGVTEYLAHKLMKKTGVLTREQFHAVCREKDLRYRDTPGWDALTLADAARDMDDMSVYSLVYTKGFLVGYLLDREMSRRSGPEAFENALRVLFRDHNFYHDGAVLEPGDVRGVFEAASPGAGLLIDRYAMGSGRLPALEPDIAGNRAP